MNNINLSTSTTKVDSWLITKPCIANAGIISANDENGLFVT